MTSAVTHTILTEGMINEAVDFANKNYGGNRQDPTPESFDVRFCPTDEQIYFFLPEQSANRPYIICWAHVGQHSEASRAFFQSLEPITTAHVVDLTEDLKTLILNYDYNLRYVPLED